MEVLGIRFATVTPEAEALAGFLDKIGFPQRDMSDLSLGEGFQGAIFPAGTSWVEIWPQGPEMPVGVMLQVVVDDADAFAAQARANGLDPQGPMDAHGERIYFLQAPSGLNMSFQSALPA
jgi:hypothetical protein